MEIEHTFQYTPQPNETPKTVIVTGTFDNWTGTLEMTPSGKVFEKTVTIRILNEELSAVHYKFIVDGVWKFDELLPTTSDDKGNENNVVFLYVDKAAHVSAEVAAKDKPVFEQQDSLASIPDAPAEAPIKKEKGKKKRECLIL
jgi:hypothetical protein